MTRDQMHSEFKFLMDKVDSSANPLFLSQEIDKLLNISQDKFVNKRAFGNNVRRTSFEEDQKRRDDLRTLISRIRINNPDIEGLTPGVIPNSATFTLPSSGTFSGGYRHSIMEEALVIPRSSSPESTQFGVNIIEEEIPLQGDNVNQIRVSVKPITHDRYTKIMDDPFNKPEKNSVYRLDSSDEDYNKQVILIHSEDTVVSQYILHYIREPLSISSGQDCILPNHTHREIVRMAVVEALEGIESPRYQSSKIELNEIE